ncbi:DUF2793 domain-containing protein [Labrenzia sp. PHM005]|uniref:DUF2793 domain-containing protein n=1 Tax=Labrenzia sp. PHM005 TaxID=2590016 RepID=UPI0011406DAB|nr:DUF2793 domain-containing protein [Labrenzia sp. PHM005]QDG74462.1 DUF2793 domain-containing protein [Labrenzia sp. PHM005]
MSTTARLNLPFIAASQAQKEITHNEALTVLDALSHLAALDRDLTAPPAVSDGDSYIVGIGGSGDWTGQDGKIAHYADGAWTFLEPFVGLIAFIADEGTLAVYTSSGWADYGALLSQVATLSRTPSGAESRMCTVEEELTGLSGVSVDTSIVIPNRAVVWCVSTRTTTAITGATSYDCGISGETSKFGGSLGIAEGSTNAGVIGPQAFYSDTNVRLTANGGSFTAGAVKVALHYLLPVVP